MRVLVTRPTDDAAALAAALRARGHEPVMAPLMSIAPVEAEIDLEGAQALLFTSANGVRAFARAQARRDIAVLAVGPATAGAARAAGFTEVREAGGDVQALAELARLRLKPDAGALVHVAGSQVAGDLAGELERAGFRFRRVVLYRQDLAGTLPEEASAALRAGTIDAVLLFSPRSAEIFARLTREAGLDVSRLAVVALSPAVLAALGGLGARLRLAAARPNEDSLLDALEAIAPRPAPARAPRRSQALPTLASLLALAALAGVVWLAQRPDDRAPLEARLAAVEQRLARPVEPSVPPAVLARLDAIDRRLAEPPGVPASITAQLSELNERAGALARRLSALEAMPTPPDPSARLEDLRARAERLEAEIAERWDREAAQRAGLTVETRRLAGELARLQEETTALAAQSAHPAARREAFHVALAQLRQAIGAGRPFAEEAATLQVIAGDEAQVAAALAALAPAASRGVPTSEALRAQFARLASLAARAPLDDTSPWWRRAIDRLAGMVSIRPVGEVPGERPAAILARAERRVETGDLAAASRELEALAAPPPALVEWRESVQRRLAVDRALVALANFASSLEATPP